MKKLLILLLITTFCQAQGSLFVSSEADVRNAIMGSPVNEPAYDGIFSIGYRTGSATFQASYETFKAIGFQSFNIRGGKVFELARNFKLTPIAGTGMTLRERDWAKRLTPSLDLSLQPEYHFRNWFVFLRGEGRYRGDLDRIVNSGFFGIGVKI